MLADVMRRAAGKKKIEAYTDFSEYTTGTVPAGWADYWRTDSHEWHTREGTAGTSFIGGKSLEHNASFSARRFLAWADLGEIKNVEVLTRAITTNTSGRQNGVILRGSDSGFNSETGYAIHYAPGASGGLEIGSFLNGNFTSLGVFSTPVYHQVYFRIRAQIKGNSIKAKIWRDTDPEPSSWSLEVTNSDISNGFVGTFAFNREGSRRWDVFQVQEL